MVRAPTFQGRNLGGLPRKSINGKRRLRASGGPSAAAHHAPMNTGMSETVVKLVQTIF